MQSTSCDACSGENATWYTKCDARGRKVCHVLHTLARMCLQGQAWFQKVQCTSRDACAGRNHLRNMTRNIPSVWSQRVLGISHDSCAGDCQFSFSYTSNWLWSDSGIRHFIFCLEKDSKVGHLSRIIDLGRAAELFISSTFVDVCRTAELVLCQSERPRGSTIVCANLVLDSDTRIGTTLCWTLVRLWLALRFNDSLRASNKPA